MAHSITDRFLTFAKPDLKWRRPSFRGWLALSLVVLTFTGVIVFFTPMAIGWKLIGGISMEPTMSWRSYVWTEALDDPASELKIGDLVCVENVVIGKSCKRVIEIDPERGIYVVGDNKAISSMDSSYDPSGQEVWIPFEDVRYRVKDILTLRRLLRDCTEEGKFRNWLEFHEPMWARKAAQNDYLIFELQLNEHGHVVDVIKQGVPGRVRLNGQLVGWSDNTLVYRDNKSNLRYYDPSTGKSEVIKTKLTPVTTGKVELVVRNSGNTFFGPTYVLIGKSLPKTAKLRITGKTYTLRSYSEFDHDPIIKEAVASFSLTPRDDSVPSGTITAEVVSDEP